MAKVTLAPFVKDIRGAVGETVFKRSHTGELIATKKPDMSKVQWSPAQKAQRQRFKKANAYAKAALSDPAVRAKYEAAAAQTGKRPHTLAVSDYFKGIDLLKPK